MLNQMIAYHLTAQGFMEGHIERIRHVYRQRRDVMLDTLQRHFPATASWTRPEGGMFLWLTLPSEIDTEEMLQEAIMQKVVFVPGNAFYAQEGGRNSMRLNFSNTEPERIEQGIERLSRVLQTRWQRV
jgi:2-aminoadipate transaminase